MNRDKRLSELRVGECARVSGLLSCGSLRRRFLDIGLSPGTLVFCVGKSPLGDPLAYIVRGCEIAIRKRDSETVVIE